ncbi:hypothetical protein CFOL_v3_19811 [Cephalotus follicularis]|uniref:DUF8040 domain-containing protein n=1 Tax=Cephalotus follicularis TaxID=3775 RepID=A0A1Q3C7R0_CEPFO|nr:hypothetical protein CFOL_v3_19811 [Cephalotus follicularis]
MNRQAFTKLCQMLTHVGGLKCTQNMLVDEQVAMCLHILTHHVKNRVVKFRFRRSEETISRHFKNVLNALIRSQGQLLKKSEPVLESSTDGRWKWFKVYKIIFPSLVVNNSVKIRI